MKTSVPGSFGSNLAGPSVLFVRGTGAVVSALQWEEPPGPLTAFEARLDGPAPEVGATWSSAWSHPDPLLGGRAVGSASGSSWRFEWARPRSVGHRRIRLAWCVGTQGEERVFAVTHHEIRVLPAPPCGPFLEGPLDDAFVALVCARAAGASTSLEALRRFGERLWQDPGKLAYVPDQASLAASDELVEYGLRALTTDDPSEAISSSEAGGLILDLPVSAASDDLPCQLFATCHGFARFGAAVAALLGLRAELWSFEDAPQVVSGTRALHNDAFVAKDFGRHTVAVVLQGDETWVCDLALAPPSGFRLLSRAEYHATVLRAEGALSRSPLTIARPRVYRGLDGVPDALKEEILANARKKDGTVRKAVRVYVSQSSPAWVQVLYFDETGRELQERSGLSQEPVEVVWPRSPDKRMAAPQSFRTVGRAR